MARTQRPLAESHAAPAASIKQRTLLRREPSFGTYDDAESVFDPTGEWGARCVAIDDIL